MSTKDTLYRNNEPIKPFEFNQRVVDVFPDMISRSVPGYPMTISMISVIANEFIQDKTNVYDLGCSLGAVSYAITQSVRDKSYQIIAADNSEAMINACNENKGKGEFPAHVSFVCQDVFSLEIKSASLVVMNFTLQFIAQDKRQILLDNIYKGLNERGVFILSEKISFADDNETATMIDLHHGMKRLNGYDDLEIAGKRDALENVLIPETVEIHQERLKSAGFSEVYVWLKCFNFVSFIAIK